MDLAEFVSDYLAIDDGVKVTAKDIAIAYVDATTGDPMTEADFNAAVKEITPQVRYYL
jgi:hypothetical protein